MNRYIGYTWIFATIFLTVYGQLVLKWRITEFGPLPKGQFETFRFLISLIFDPLICSGFVAAFLASLAWMAAMTKFDLSHAYPFMSLNFVLVFLFSGWLLSETITIQKAVGIGLIVVGTIVTARG